MLDTSELPTRLKHLALRYRQHRGNGCWPAVRLRCAIFPPFARFATSPASPGVHVPVACNVRPCSNYNEGHSLDIVLPEGMKQLELLSARADSVVSRTRGRRGRPMLRRCPQARVAAAEPASRISLLAPCCSVEWRAVSWCRHSSSPSLPQFLDWVDVCARCEEVQVAASLAVLRVGREPVACLVREVGYSSLQVSAACSCAKARGWQAWSNVCHGSRNGWQPGGPPSPPCAVVGLIVGAAADPTPDAAPAAGPAVAPTTCLYHVYRLYCRTICTSACRQRWPRGSTSRR